MADPDDHGDFLAWLSRRLVWFSLVLLFVGIVAGAYFAWRLTRDEAETFADPVAQFKYGSTGGDRNFGIPYAMWQVMPTLFRDLMPPGREDEGWAAFGFITEDPADLPPELHHPRPVGTSLRNTMGLDRIFLNCAGCHAGSVRVDANGKPLVIAGMPSNTVDLSAFQGFLAKAAVDERFSADRFLAQIEADGVDVDLVNRLAIRFVGVGLVRERLLAIVDRFEDFVHNEPTFGPGRFDTFNPAKALLNWNLADLPERERIGVVDFPAVFLQGEKTGMQLHWDGNNTKVSERNRSAAFGTGATPPILDRESLKRMEDWLAVAEPPEVHRRLPRPVRRGAGGRGRAGLRPRMRRMPRRLGPRLQRRVRRQGDADRRDRHRPRPARQLHPRPRGEPEPALRRLRRRALPDLPQDRTATPTRRSTDSGCARPTCTTARCRRSRRCWPRRRSAPRCSCAATTSTTRGRWASSATPPASTPLSGRVSSATPPTRRASPPARPARRR